MINLAAGFKRKSLYAGLAVAILAALVVMVGWIWLGWGYIAQNRWLLKSVPVPTSAERIYVRSGGGYGSDDMVLTPPEGWGTLARFRVSGYTRQEIVDLLRQRSRPYLFSNSLAPSIVTASLKAIELLADNSGLRDRLWANTRFFRERIAAAGFEILPGEHPIVPIMLGDAALANRFANRMLEKGVYVIGFSYPVVPKGKARIRTQISAAHSLEDLETAVEKFAETKAEFHA